MKQIKNFESKNEGLFYILKNILWNKDKTEDDYYNESSELLFIIEGVTDVKELSAKILSYYLVNAVNDSFSNYEGRVPDIARDYLIFIKDNNF